MLMLANCIAADESQVENMNKENILKIVASYDEFIAGELVSGENAVNTRFLASLNIVMQINDFVVTTERPTLNVVFTGRNGQMYESGVDPSSISDREDRETYKKLIFRNAEYSENFGKIISVKRDLIKTMRSLLEKMPSTDKKYASEIMKLVSKPG